MILIEGIIYKLLSGTYYVNIGSETLACKARGLFRLEEIKPLVGDRVSVQRDSFEKGKGVIIEVKERATELTRPPVANVNQAVIVVAVKRPKPNIHLLDKMLILCEQSNIYPIITINKSDLDESEEVAERIANIYANTGYPLLKTSAMSLESTDRLKDILKDNISVFAGPSGVGKSSLLNAMIPNLKLQTGAVSKKIERGKHTTRHVELIELPFGGMVLDTPGFTSLDMTIELADLANCFPEFVTYSKHCRFGNCMHINEPNCAVIQALNREVIHFSRYQSYKMLYRQIENNRRNKS